VSGSTPTYDQAYADYQLNRSRLRKLARTPWLRAAARFAQGPAVDLGCGVGELLARLPGKSIGLEINRASIAHCQAQGLDVSYYDGRDDDWALGPVRERHTAFDTLIISHVLEHLEDPADVLHRVLFGAGGAGIRRALVIVPSAAGFKHDPTHLTFVDQAMLADPALTDGTGFSTERTSWFPGNVRRIGDWFSYHELRALYVRA
jgi:SAM-dependent methyltransferase